MSTITRESLGLEEGNSASQEGTKSFIEEIQDEVKSVALEAEQARELAKQSLDFLAALSMPTVFKYFFPDTFQQIWNWLVANIHKKRDFSQLAIGLPRGFGKTMVMKLFILYTILFTDKKFILVLCGTQTKANNVITDVMSMLGDSNLRSLFGDWQLGAEQDRQDIKRFGFRGRNVILMGAGSGSDIRGITLENERPDLMIFDDIQTREEAESEQVSGNLETWMTGTAMKAKSPHGCLFVFIANMYPTKYSILRKLKTNPTWMKFIVGGILTGGISLWEELQPIKQLLREYENDLAMGHPEIFFSEVLNDETASVNRFVNVDLIPHNPYEHDTQHSGNFIVIDPATDKKNSDLVSIGYFELFDGKPVLKELVEDRMSPSESIKEALKLCLKHGCSLVAVEANAYQYTYLHWFGVITEQMGIIGINCVDVYSGQVSKASRILEMFKGLIRKKVLAKDYKSQDPNNTHLHEYITVEPEVYIAAACRSEILAYITAYNPLKADNTDGALDLLTYANKVVELYGHFILSGLTLQMNEYSKLEVLSEADNCSF